MENYNEEIHSAVQRILDGVREREQAARQSNEPTQSFQPLVPRESMSPAGKRMFERVNHLLETDDPALYRSNPIPPASASSTEKTKTGLALKPDPQREQVLMTYDRAVGKRVRFVAPDGSQVDPIYLDKTMWVAWHQPAQLVVTIEAL